MKRYQTTYTNGYSVETSSPYEAVNYVNHGDGQTFALSGKPVTAEAFFSAARDSIQAKFDKKCETHKLIRVRYGATSLCYVDKWVKK